jgi:uncharacterized membrane protein
MRTPASIFKHPIHPMLIVFPIGLWIFSLACDLIRLAGATTDAWSTVAFFSMIGGLVGALCAAVPGFIDLFFYKGGAPPGKKIALTHMAVSLTAVTACLGPSRCIDRPLPRHRFYLSMDRQRNVRG